MTARHYLAAILCTAACAKHGAGPEAKDTSQPVTAAALTAPAAPAEIAVPEGHKPTFMAKAKGVQVYECAAGEGGALAWKLHAPKADLLDDSGAVIGSHFGGVDKGMPPGPYWEAKDGSRVHAGKPANAPHEGSIPLLRLEAVDVSGTGVFAKVSFVQRLDTAGGVAPTGACTAGQTTEVPYTATYYFFAPATQG